MEQPDTTMGRRLATRALAVATLSDTAREPAGVRLDLTTPAFAAPPAHVREAAKAALDRGETHYTSGPGVPELRAALAAHSTSAGFPATVEGVVVTNGGSEALYIALQSTLRAGDRALLGGPVAPNVVEMIRFIGAEPVALPLHAAERFLPSPADIAASEASVLLLASPSPVTGVAIPDLVLERLIGEADARGMTVILDRALAWCGYETGETPFANADLGTRVLTTGSFSMAYAMGGWRVGWLSAPATRMAAMRELKLAMSICTSAVSQFAALAALEGPGAWLEERRAGFRARRELAIRALAAGGIDVLAPDAWPPLLLDTRLMLPDDHAAAALIAKEAGVRVTPASRYSAALAGYVAIDLGVETATLREGIEQLIAFHTTCW